MYINSSSNYGNKYNYYLNINNYTSKQNKKKNDCY